MYEIAFKKADSVRDYFIILRKFINYYKNIFIKGINESIKLNPSKCVYVLLVNKNKKIFKIGKTKHIKKRLQTYAAGKNTHSDIKYIMLIDNPDIIEKCVKTLLKTSSHKKNKEIYKTSLSCMKKIINTCVDMDI